ncbi:CCD96 protein, partial [Galbula dea]|nr:CCD96 protein [Galbula dea]
SSPGAAERRNGEAPEKGDVAEEGEEERQERAELLEELRGMSAERERLRQASTRLLLQLGELLRLGPAERREWAALGAGESKLYAQRWLRQLHEEGERASAASRLREARTRAEWNAFLARKKAVAVASINRQLGGREAVPPVADVVDRIQARERDTERRVREARVENIKLKHEIQNLETILKAQGDLVKGQHGIDFKHMKKEDQKHSENINNLSHEILNLKEKVSNTVHTLGQVREKLHFLEAENECRRAELMHIETVLAQKTQILTRRKQARDRVRANNLKLQQKCGLLGNEILLRDFEEKVDTAELLNQQLETLKRHHAGLILDCKGIQKKIKEANS